MSYTAISASQTLAGKPVDQTLMDAIRLDLADHETRLLAAFAFGNNAIIDDFDSKIGTGGVAASVWNVDHAGANNDPVVAAQHQLQCPINTGGAGAYSLVYGADGKIRIAIAEEYTAVLQFRCYRAGANSDSYFMGWQNVGLAGVNRVTNVGDMIGFYRDGATGNWTFQLSKAAASVTQTNLLTGTAWGVFRLTVTCSATTGNRSIKVETGTTEANLAGISGSPFDWTTYSANIPTVSLQPVFGSAYQSAGGDLRTDYCLAYTAGRPLAA
jgi:hypothetical protein